MSEKSKAAFKRGWWSCIHGRPINVITDYDEICGWKEADLSGRVELSEADLEMAAASHVRATAILVRPELKVEEDGDILWA